MIIYILMNLIYNSEQVTVALDLDNNFNFRIQFQIQNEATDRKIFST